MKSLLERNLAPRHREKRWKRRASGTEPNVFALKKHRSETAPHEGYKLAVGRSRENKKREERKIKRKHIHMCIYIYMYIYRTGKRALPLYPL